MKKILFLIILILFSTNSLAITYQYDDLNRLTLATYDDGSTVEYSYDPAGNITLIKTVAIITNHTISGSVSGLESGNSVVLQNNGGNNQTVSANGNFTFPTALADNSAYAVSVLTQPASPDQTCSITNGSGTLSGADITNVSVTCVTTPTTVSPTYVGTTATGTGVATASIDSGGGQTCGFDPDNTGFVAASSIVDVAPTNKQFAHGLFRFKLIQCDPASNVAITVQWPNILLTGAELWKYGPITAGAASTWFQPASAIIDLANNTTIHTVVNNGEGDLDADIHSIVDPVGVAVTIVPPASSDDTILIGLSRSAGAGFLETIANSEPHNNQHWPRVNWSEYNNAAGESRPVQCDLDGDGTHELVIGLGSYPINGGWIEVKDDKLAGYAHLAWLNIGWNFYNNSDGQTWPACGDIDGDGKDEIVVGLGDAGKGWVKVFDDADTGFAAFPGTPTAGGWLQMSWGFYNNTVGTIHPAVGNLDNDTREEIVLGVDTGGSGWMQIIDDAVAGFAHLEWRQLGWGHYNKVNGATWPTICDLDGNQIGEIVIGLEGTDGSGWLQILDANNNYAGLSCTIHGDGWMRQSWGVYNTANGTTHPACLNLDGDLADELVIGMGLDSFGWLEIRDDCSTNIGHKSWARVHWPIYNSTKGITWPASKR